MKGFWFSTLKILLMICCLAYAGYHMYLYWSQPVDTSRVDFATIEDSVVTQCVIVRDEEAVASDTKDERLYLIKDGEKVYKGEKAVQLYKTQDEISRKRKLDDINDRLEQLKAAEQMIALFETDTRKVDEQIKNITDEIVILTSEKNIKGVEGLKSGLQLLLNKKNIIVGETKNLSSSIEKLKTMRDSLQDSESAKTGDIAAPAAGYFSYISDGYEDLLKDDVIDALSVADMQKLMSEVGNENKQSLAVGKIVTSFEWKMYCVLTDEQSRDLFVNNDKPQQITIRFPYAINEDLKVYVHLISESADGKKIVVFKSNYITPEILHLRSQTVEIVKKQYTGLKIDARALRIVDGVNGAYVKIGSQMFFREIDEIFKSDTFVLSNYYETEDKKFVTLYDEVIVKGIDLADGKIIN